MFSACLAGVLCRKDSAGDAVLELTTGVPPARVVANEIAEEFIWGVKFASDA